LSPCTQKCAPCFRGTRNFLFIIVPVLLCFLFLLSHFFQKRFFKMVLIYKMAAPIFQVVIFSLKMVVTRIAFRKSAAILKKKNPWFFFRLLQNVSKKHLGTWRVRMKNDGNTATLRIAWSFWKSTPSWKIFFFTIFFQRPLQAFSEKH
jgi:hypothetical protein